MDYFGTKLHCNNKHLYWENDEPFFYLADTNWYALTSRCTEDEFERILKDRKEKGFTAIQVVIGPPPESSIFSENAKSTHGHLPFTHDYKINYEYFQDIHRKIHLIVEYELVPVVFGSWGHYIDEVGSAGMINLWSAIIEYCAKYPVIYVLCGEVDIIQPGLKPGLLQRIINKLPFVKKAGKILFRMSQNSFITERITKWQKVADHLVSINKEKHPVTVHIHSPQLASEVFINSDFIDIDSFQSGHSLRGVELMEKLFSKAKKGKRSYINLEPLYEGILDQFDTRFQNYAFYKSLFSGAAGHAYGAHGLWQMAKADNFMPHWGRSQWNKALAFPGSTSIGKAKDFLQNHVNWIQVEDISNKIKIDYYNNPKLNHTAGKYGNKILVYVPYANKVKSVDLIKNKTKYTAYNPNTFAIIKKGLELSENEMILEFSIV